MANEHRFFICPSDGSTMTGTDSLKAAREAVLEMGEGALIVDTMAQTYRPMLQVCRDGEVIYAGFGGWDTGKFGLNRDFLESIKKGNVVIVKAFLAKGANVNAADGNGGPALHWAVGGGKLEIVQLLLDRGADISATDRYDQTALELAKKKEFREIIDILTRAQEAG